MTRLLLAVCAALLAIPAMADTLRVLSAGAVEPGLVAFARVVKQEAGHDLAIEFNTAPRIAQRLAAGETFDIVIAPPAVLAQGVKDGKLQPETRVAMGRVGAGVVVRNGAAPPDIANVEALKQALLAADSVVYNTASTGLYLDKLFEQWGLAATLKPKATRYPDGASVMEHVIRGKGNEIGFGAITEIRLYEAKGAKLVGPLPADVQNYTSYDAVAMTGAKPSAASVLALRATPAGRAAFTAAGID